MQFLRIQGLCQVVTCVLLCCMLLLGVSGCSRTRLDAASPQLVNDEAVLLPSTGSGVPYLLRTSVNGIGPYLFVLDTGSSRTVVSPRLVEELGLDARANRSPVVNAEGKPINAAGEVRLGEVVIGPLSVRGVDALVMDMNHLERTLGERIDGIASGALFRDLTLIMDDDLGEVRVTHRRLASRGALPLGRGAIPTVTADVAGVPMPVMIDSASAGSWMIPTEGFETQDAGYADRSVTLAEGQMARSRRRLTGAVYLGGHKFLNPIVEHTEGVARIGWHAMAGFRVSIDQRSGLALFEWPGQEVSFDGPVRGIGARLVRVGEVWEARRVEPSMPASQAGLRDGERIIAVEGRRTDELTDFALRELIERSGRVRLDVLRETGVEQVFVPVVSIEP